MWHMKYTCKIPTMKNCFITRCANSGRVSAVVANLSHGSILLLNTPTWTGFLDQFAVYVRVPVMTTFNLWSTRKLSYPDQTTLLPWGVQVPVRGHSSSFDTEMHARHVLFMTCALHGMCWECICCPNYRWGCKSTMSMCSYLLWSARLSLGEKKLARHLVYMQYGVNCGNCMFIHAYVCMHVQKVCIKNEWWMICQFTFCIILITQGTRLVQVHSCIIYY